jgi:hypothetical protein
VQEDKPLSGPADSPSRVLCPASLPLPQVYGRDTEKARLQRMGGTEPTNIALFTGPPNSGKTVLLKDYCDGRQQQGVCYMDCRQVGATTPAGEAHDDLAPRRTITSSGRDDHPFMSCI